MSQPLLNVSPPIGRRQSSSSSACVSWKGSKETGRGRRTIICCPAAGFREREEGNYVSSSSPWCRRPLFKRRRPMTTPDRKTEKRPWEEVSVNLERSLGLPYSPAVHHSEVNTLRCFAFLLLESLLVHRAQCRRSTLVPRETNDKYFSRQRMRSRS